MKVWQCTVCKYIHRGDTPPDKCPICHAGANKFKEIDEASIPEKRPKRKQQKPQTDKASFVVQDKTRTMDESNFEKIKSLMVKHHAHPVIVHTPNGLLPVAVILWLLAWIFDSGLLAKAAFINQIFVIISLPLVIFTGVTEWQQKYNRAMTTIFKIKIMAAILTSIACLTTTIWFFIDPEILLSSWAWSFMFINIVMLAAAGIAGHIGGKLVFKD
ncbi:MAG: rubredoxin-like domain-containing protein [Thermodesulfobacteriota bacterium]